MPGGKESLGPVKASQDVLGKDDDRYRYDNQQDSQSQVRRERLAEDQHAYANRRDRFRRAQDSGEGGTDAMYGLHQGYVGDYSRDQCQQDQVEP